jgi:hypothetical protein
MKDRQGRGWMERHREKSFESGFHDDFKAELKRAMDEHGNIEALKKFTSRRSLIKSLIPQFIVGIFLSYIEYRIIGLLYTIASLAIFIPALSMYARSLRTRSGTFLMVPQDGAMDWERIFVSEEIWSLIDKKTGLTLEQGKINGRVTYWCTDVKFLQGTSIPYFVEIAWAHYNRAKYMMFASVLDDLTEMLQNTLLEVAKLRQTSKVEAIVEGTRQTKEMIDHIESAFRDTSYDIIKKQDLDEDQAQIYQEQVEGLLQNPTFLRALAEKRKKEVEE